MCQNDLATQGIKFALYSDQLNREIKKELAHIDQIGKVFEKIGAGNFEKGRELFQLALLVQQAAFNIQSLLDQFICNTQGAEEVQP